MTTLINLTPHPIRLLDADGNLVREIPPSGKVLRLAEQVEPVGTLDGVPVVSKQFLIPNGGRLPPLRSGTFYIVSLPVAQLLRLHEFLVPDDLVRDEHGNVIGCRRLATLAW